MDRVVAAAWNPQDIQILKKVSTFFRKKGVLIAPNFERMPGGAYDFQYLRHDNTKVIQILTALYGKPLQKSPDEVQKFYKQPKTNRSLEIWLLDMRGSHPDSQFCLMSIYPKGSGI